MMRVPPVDSYPEVEVSALYLLPESTFKVREVSASHTGQHLMVKGKVSLPKEAWREV